ncbi:hypothetical protein EVAR_22384_1 [Eumeta japonica]|uniref:Uncharacterized protein n=1 Tax=Eumeta variegata TaxID=151549 RepID=A0A4C1VLU5_EUMVA|nr:hypothetical protein EVAR_22384_1 [Eumeta japonica]
MLGQTTSSGTYSSKETSRFLQSRHSGNYGASSSPNTPQCQQTKTEQCVLPVMTDGERTTPGLDLRDETRNEKIHKMMRLTDITQNPESASGNSKATSLVGLITAGVGRSWSSDRELDTTAWHGLQLGGMMTQSRSKSQATVG